MSSADEILELIPREDLQPQQIAQDLTGRETWPVYRLLRTPQHVRQLYRSESATPIVVRTENGSLLYLWHRRFEPRLGSDNRSLLNLDWTDWAPVTCKIVGRCKEDVFATATMIWNLSVERGKSIDSVSGSALTG